MDQTQWGIISLLCSAVTGAAGALPDGFELEAAYDQILQHGVVPLAYEGAVLCGIDKSLPVMRKLFSGYCQCLLKSEKQMEAIAELSEAFEKNGIDYLPLKGCNLKKLYPKAEMRTMGDADILIRPEQYERIRPIMLELGYEEQEKSEYDYKWDSEKLHLELHWRIVRPADKEFFAYFGGGWERARLTGEGTHYGYRPEDEFIHLFVHLVKHYRDSGIGLKHVTDIWVYQNAHPEMDDTYIHAELEKIHLLEFFLNLQKMLRVWFDGAVEDEKSGFIADVIFNSGAFGHQETYIVSIAVRAAKESGSSRTAKRHRMVHLLFPPIDELSSYYKFLEKLPALLPACWIHRWFRVGLFQREKYEKQKQRIEFITPEKIETYQQALNYVGLDFNEK